MKLLNPFFEKKFMAAALYTIVPILQILFYLFTQRIHNFQDFLTLLIPLITFFSLGLFIEYFCKLNFNFRTCIFIILILIFIDQITKIIVKNSVSFDIIPNHLIISPIKNIHNSAFLSYFNFEIPLLLIICSKIFSIFLGVFIYYFVKHKLAKYSSEVYITLFLITFLAGVFCSLIDTIAWGYSLDFLKLPCFVTIDIKDIYISLSTVFIFIIYLKDTYYNKIKNQSNLN